MTNKKTTQYWRGFFHVDDVCLIQNQKAVFLSRAGSVFFCAYLMLIWIY